MPRRAYTTSACLITFNPHFKSHTRISRGANEVQDGDASGDRGTQYPSAAYAELKRLIKYDMYECPCVSMYVYVRTYACT